MMADIVERLRATHVCRELRAITVHQLNNPDGPEAADLIEKHRAAIEGQITHVENRIKDGDEMGARVWRVALEDVANNLRAILAAIGESVGE